jgi:hypothetical protein
MRVRLHERLLCLSVVVCHELRPTNADIVYVCMYVYIYTHTQTHTHTCMYIYICPELRPTNADVVKILGTGVCLS